MNENINKLLRERYFVNEEEKTWEDLSKRSASIYQPILQYIVEKYFIPSSPTLMNAGTKRGTLSSCFPLQIQDSIDGIFTALHQGAIVTKNAGGCGWDFSVLRSSRENIKTLDAPSSGPLAFIESFNAMLDSIRQGGKRRGAGMALLDIHHPDIVQFINAKQNTDKIERLNMSIKIDNEFYEQLKKDPHTQHILKDVVTGQEYGAMETVQQVWDIIINAAWTTAEPGIFNSDIAFQRCTVTNIGKTVICNPCVSGDTLVSTNEGDISINKIYQEFQNGQRTQIEIYSFNLMTMEVEKEIITKVFLTQENAEIIEIYDEENNILKVTPDHKIYVENKGWIFAKDLLEDDVIIKLE
jgi:ribonucleoside-diphosphate reductase alpha chain